MVRNQNDRRKTKENKGGTRMETEDKIISIIILFCIVSLLMIYFYFRGKISTEKAFCKVLMDNGKLQESPAQNVFCNDKNNLCVVCPYEEMKSE